MLKYSYNKVMSDPDLRPIWQEACEKEFAQFLEPGRTEWGIPKQGDKIIHGFWRLLEFFNSAGQLIKRKARFCVMGNHISAKENDFDFSFSATVSYDQVRLLAALCATSDKMLFTADVRGAYLGVERETKPGHRVLWLKPPPGYEHPKGSQYCLLIKACLYGLRDSGRRWWMKFRKALEKAGFLSVDQDPCMWVRDTESTAKGKPPDIKSKTYALVATWVDDSLILASHSEFERIVAELKRDGIDIDKVEEARKFVGVDIRVQMLNTQDDGSELITYDNIATLQQYGEKEHMVRPRVELVVRNAASRAREVLLTQTQYIVDTFHASGAEIKPCVQTPAPKGWVIDRRDMPATPNKDDVAYFRSIYGKVLHIMRCTRPDVAFVVSELGRVSSSPSKAHIAMLKRVCQYLYNTRGLGLRYGGADVRRARNEKNRIQVQVMHDFEPIVYADASWADDPADRRSMGGYAIFMNGSVIAYRSKRQTFAVGSTCESEILSMSSVVKDVAQLSRALADMGIFNGDQPPTVAFEDNECCIAHSNDNNSLGRTKALDLRYVIVRQAVQNKILDLRKVRSSEQLADCLCKMADTPTFIAMRNAMLGMTIDDVPPHLKEQRRGKACPPRSGCSCSPDLDDAENRARRRAAARERQAQQGARAASQPAARVSRLVARTTAPALAGRWLPWW